MTGNEAVEALPDRVRIGAFEIAIIVLHPLSTENRREWGHFSSVEQLIRLQKEWPSGAKAVDTFLHECLHGIFWAYYIADEDKEERTVAMVAGGLTALHRDNPWLAGWITAALA